MTVMEAIEGRRSIRQYLDKPIEKEKMDKVIEAFRLAPSAGNNQTWQLLVVTDPAKKAKVREATISKREMVTQASAVLVAVSARKDTMSNGQAVDTTDVCIALTMAMLEAWELGLGTCWMANYTEPAMREALGLPETTSVVAIMPIGYAAENPPAKPRKPVEDIVAYI